MMVVMLMMLMMMVMMMMVVVMMIGRKYIACPPLRLLRNRNSRYWKGGHGGEGERGIFGWILDIMYCFESDILFWFGLSVGFGWSGIGGGRASESNFYDRFKIQLFMKTVFGKILPLLENMKILTGFKWKLDFYSGSTINIARVEEMVTSPVRGKPTRREETRAATNEGEERGGGWYWWMCHSRCLA